MSAQVIRMSLLDMQVCVPKAWTDQQALAYADKAYPCGTSEGWRIRRQGHRRLKGMDERVKCDECADHVHIMMDS